MIYTLQRWPDVVTNLVAMYTNSKVVVLKESQGKLVICLPSGEKELPFQDSVSLFFSQPSARRDFSKHALDEYDHFVVDVTKGLVCIATAEQAEPYITGTVEHGEYDKDLLSRYEKGVKGWMRGWINSQMEYLPLDEDEQVVVYALNSKAC